MPLTTGHGEGGRNLSDREFALFQKFFHERIGFHLAQQKRQLVASRLGRRVATLGLDGFRSYHDLLLDPQSAEERQWAIDLITTNETAFFRENDHFRLLSEIILPGLSRGREVAVWCGASSTGEEPYSLAMVLHDRFGATGWTLKASDVNQEVLGVARQGLYPMERAVPIPERFLKAYCLRGTGDHSGKFIVSAHLRQMVDFQQINLLNLPIQLRDLDVVFLRNVMIYFDQQVREKVLNSIWGKLRPGGWLVLGHSESVVGLHLPPLEVISPSVYQKPQSRR